MGIVSHRTVELAKRVIRGYTPTDGEAAILATAFLAAVNETDMSEDIVGLSGGSDFSEGEDITESLYEEKN